MKKTHSFLTFLLLAALFFGISACGKVSAPEPIAGSGYPHTYPRR